MHIIAREGFVKANPIWKPYKGTLQIKLNYWFGTRISFNFSLFLELLKLFSKSHWNKIFVWYLLFFHLNLCIYAITSFSFFYSSSPSLSVPPSLSLSPYPFPLISYYCQLLILLCQKLSSKPKPPPMSYHGDKKRDTNPIIILIPHPILFSLSLRWTSHHKRKWFPSCPHKIEEFRDVNYENCPHMSAFPYFAGSPYMLKHLPTLDMFPLEFGVPSRFVNRFVLHEIWIPALNENEISKIRMILTKY